ncbi:DUF4190 domain-containing protein [Cryobacterium psychrophilum]|uniref:Uncharacterized protein n=1 Tax=Cryobacterium psychrophilum TaxID=41988 RepID=A0A4Y8KR59_9MICO|nr:DUF4190 domain-containing protein [Cryobacterium psychrophilum]TDW29649.1 hypothetical protein EDD25_1359 [Cryobacterium psychrophilum]TFD81765.1 hypothetical protein E3T53_01865 [Cryobacterium psychrophilum]
MSDPNTPQVPDVPKVPGVPPVSPPSAPAPPPSYGAPIPPPAGGSATPPPPSYGAPANPYESNPYTGTTAKKPPMFSILAMIAGIIGVIGSPIAILPFVGGFLGLLFPVAGVVLGFLGKKREPTARGFWLTGIISGFVGIGLMLLSFGLWALIFAAGSSYDYTY